MTYPPDEATREKAPATGPSPLSILNQAPARRGCEFEAGLLNSARPFGPRDKKMGMPENIRKSVAKCSNQKNGLRTSPGRFSLERHPEAGLDGRSARLTGDGSVNIDG